MITDITTAVTDALYQGLFGLTIAQVNDVLGLMQGTDEEVRRDHMGILALKALKVTENAMTYSFKQMPKHVSMSLDQLTTFARGMGEITSSHYAERGVQGIDLLTRNEMRHG